MSLHPVVSPCLLPSFFVPLFISPSSFCPSLIPFSCIYLSFIASFYTSVLPSVPSLCLSFLPPILVHSVCFVLLSFLMSVHRCFIPWILPSLRVFSCQSVVCRSHTTSQV
ncbi:hypothetical protein ILYODFUR_038080 [Ilyodon furcidens]|uniref:Uncharacterized protein n=1 Tax=Ilyodon furcidens TaxID=33524 RepID=A0ABV0UZM1_9TELE